MVRIVRQGKEIAWYWGPLGGTRKCTNPVQTLDKREEEKMHKQYEDEPRRIEHAHDATITFTIALHGPHAWEMVLEDSGRYHSISHGWATDDPHGWEDAIAPVLRQFFGKALTPRRAAFKVLGEHAAVLKPIGMDLKASVSSAKACRTPFVASNQTKERTDA
jgi:hypothetical protein